MAKTKKPVTLEVTILRVECSRLGVNLLSSSLLLIKINGYKTRVDADVV